MELGSFFAKRSFLGLLGIVLVIVVAGLVFIFNQAETFITVPATTGAIREEVSATGKVEPPERIDLFFRSNARLIRRDVEVGDTVVRGDILAEQDASDLVASKLEAEAYVDVAKTRLDKLERGASAEEVNIGKTALQNAEQSVRDAHETLKDSLSDAYTKSDDAIFVKADQTFLNAKSSSARLNFNIPDTGLQSRIESGRASLSPTLESWRVKVQTLSSTSNILSESETAKQALQSVKVFLADLAEGVSLVSPSGSITQTVIDKWKADISTARANIGVALSTIAASEKAYQMSVGTRNSALDQLRLIEAPAREADIELARAEVRQAEARLTRALADLSQAALIAPTNGLVIDTDGHVGELVGPATTVVSLFPEGAMEIELYVSENDIVKVSVGQEALVSLDAFPQGTIWKGEVVRIDPAETIVGGAVYYRTAIVFENTDERVRSGMTAEVRIQTASREGVIVVPASAITMKDGMATVTVQTAKGWESRAVSVGIRDRFGNVEILEGIHPGDSVVIGER